MVEAPEAHVISSQLNETIRGKVITEVVAGFTPHKFAWFSGSPEEYRAMLSGCTIGPVQPEGGMIHIAAGGMSLVLSEGVAVRYIPAGGKLPSKHQLLLGFDDESCIVVSVRMYGGLVCFPQGRPGEKLKEYYEAARDKPQVLSEAFSRAYFMSIIDAEDAAKKSAKALLATGQTIPGLGNGVLQDILYNARIHPKTKVSELSPERREQLFDSIKSTLRQMCEQGGRRSESDIFGRPGGYIPLLCAETAGTPCTRCGSTIVKENYMGGSIYYCRGCQPR